MQRKSICYLISNFVVRFKRCSATIEHNYPWLNKDGVKLIHNWILPTIPKCANLSNSLQNLAKINDGRLNNRQGIGRVAWAMQS